MQVQSRSIAVTQTDKTVSALFSWHKGMVKDR